MSHTIPYSKYKCHTAYTQTLPVIMRKMRHILISILIFSGITSFGQTKQYFHKFYETASDIHISEWNIDKDKLPSAYVQETVDSNNRVIELKFFKNKTLKYDHLCYIYVWIKYEYPDENTIIEYFLDSNGEENAEIECEMPSKTIFKLSKDKRKIINTKSEYNIDREFYLNNGWTEKDLNGIIESLKSEESIYRIVSYYDKSYYKLNKIFPVSKDFQIEQFLFSNKEKEEILKSINEK